MSLEMNKLIIRRFLELVMSCREVEIKCCASERQPNHAMNPDVQKHRSSLIVHAGYGAENRV